ncbi:hypothetical protein [Rhodopseudomonas palustris]
MTIVNRSTRIGDASSNVGSSQMAARLSSRRSLAQDRMMLGDTPGEMALQSNNNHHSSYCAPQGFVQLVGYRDPSGKLRAGKAAR